MYNSHIYITRYNKGIITVIWLHNIERVIEDSKIGNIYRMTTVC